MGGVRRESDRDLPSSLRHGLDGLPDLLNLFRSELFYSHQGISGRAGTDQFVKLCLNGRAVAVLRILNQKHHQKGGDVRPRVHDQLPGVLIRKDRPCREPDHHADRRERKDSRVARRCCYTIRKFREHPGHDRSSLGFI